MHNHLDQLMTIYRPIHDDTCRPIHHDIDRYIYDDIDRYTIDYTYIL